MSYPFTKRIHSKVKYRHKFITYELDYPARKQEFFDYIIPVLKHEYGVDISEKIKNLSSKRKKILEKFMAKHNTPNPETPAPNGKLWLKNTRSKLPEIMARDILQNIDGVKFTCRTSRIEEDPDMPRRGTDNFGFVFKEAPDKVYLEYIVCCEVKASEAKQSPPKVVHASADSMFKSLKDMANLGKRLEKAIAKSIDQLDQEEYLELVCQVAESLETRENLDDIKQRILVVPFLLRIKECWTENDYGNFLTCDSEFAVSTIKYYIVTVDYPLSDFADEVYREIRER